jgi:Ssp1 endopeptidase immunity protein Rap1a
LVPPPLILPRSADGNHPTNQEQKKPRRVPFLEDDAMRRLLISGFTTAFLCLLLIPKTSASDDDEAARNVLAGCEEELKAASGAATFDLGVCLGTLKGLHYLSTDVCIPPALSLAEIAAVLSKHFDAHPKERQADFRERALGAMRSAWPCNSRENI